VAWKELAVVWGSGAINNTSHGRWFANFMEFMGEGWSGVSSLATFKSQTSKGNHAGSIRVAFFLGVVCFIPRAINGFSESNKSSSSGLSLFLRVSHNLIFMSFAISTIYAGQWAILSSYDSTAFINLEFGATVGLGES